MDRVDEHVRDGVFAEFSHTHIFGDGESQERREAWLRDVGRICRDAGVKCVVRETQDEEGEPGYELGFMDNAPKAAFIFNIYGDLEEPGAHVYSYKFQDDCPQWYREAFIIAARGASGRARHPPQVASPRGQGRVCVRSVFRHDHCPSPDRERHHRYLSAGPTSDARLPAPVRQAAPGQRCRSQE